MELDTLLYVPEDDTNYHIDIYENREKGNQIAEIYRKNNSLVISLFNNPEGNSREIDLLQLLTVLQKSYDELK